MLAEDISSRRAESSARREVPAPSPMSALMSIVRGRPLLLLFLGLARAVDRLCFYHLPVFFLVLESTPAELGQELFPDDDAAHPVGVAIIGIDWHPGELGAHALVADFAVGIASAFPLHVLSSLFLHAVIESFDAGLGRAVRAAVKGAAALNAMSDDLAAAMRAHGRKGVDGALERIEGVGFASHGDGEGLVVIVPAYLAFRHCAAPWPAARGPGCVRGDSTANL